MEAFLLLAAYKYGNKNVEIFSGLHYFNFSHSLKSSLTRWLYSSRGSVSTPHKLLFSLLQKGARNLLSLRIKLLFSWGRKEQKIRPRGIWNRLESPWNHSKTFLGVSSGVKIIEPNVFRRKWWPFFALPSEFQSPLPLSIVSVVLPSLSLSILLPSDLWLRRVVGVLAGLPPVVPINLTSQLSKQISAGGSNTPPSTLPPGGRCCFF